MAATLGGLDTLVFAAGIGEHSPEIRAEICSGLDFLGLKLDPITNERGSDLISSNLSRVSVRIIPTDEEIVIVRIIRSIL